MQKKNILRVAVAVFATAMIAASSLSAAKFGPFPPPPVEDIGNLNFGPFPPPPVEDIGS